MNPDITDIARMIDHSVLHPRFTDDDLKDHCALARKYSVASVCVKPCHVKQAAQELSKYPVGVSAVVSFPHGNSSVETKLAETLQVLNDGASEVDMVINIGKILQHDWQYVSREIGEVNNLCANHQALLKVIFETDYLPRDEEKIKLCEICNVHHVAFVKTSTGFGFVKDIEGNYGYRGATDHDLMLMRKHCISNIQIKAAGGVRTLDRLLRVRELGATRVGATATEAIMEEAYRRFGK